MSVLITSDLHFAENPRDHYRFRLFPFLKKQIKEHKVKQLLILGDLTETKDRHSAWLVNTISDGISDLSKLCRVLIMRGNHDAVVPSFPFFKFVGMMDNIVWINSPTELEVQGLGSCCFLPHTTDYKTEWKDFDFASYDWTFAHASFAGAVSESGFTLKGIPVDYFPKGSRVISGDIHKPQKIGCVTYVGSPYTVDFGDEFDPRLLLIEKGKLKSIPYVGPQKRLLVIHNDEIPDAKSLTIRKGDILKIRVLLSKDLYAEWAKIQSRIREWAEKQGYNLYVVQPVIESVFRMKSEKKRKAESKSDKQLLQEYVKSRAIDEKTVKTGLRLLRQL